MARPDIAPAVKDAVRAWGKAKDGEAGARALADARQRLPAELVPQLVQELAEISAELLLAMLTREDGLTTDAKPVDVQGVELHPKQAERLGAWLEDQQRTAKALGLDGATWQRLLDAAMTKLGASSDDASKPDATKPAAAQLSEDAKKLVGAVAASFENRPEPGKSAKAGLSGLLAARSFGAKLGAKPKKPR